MVFAVPQFIGNPRFAPGLGPLAGPRPGFIPGGGFIGGGNVVAAGVGLQQEARLLNGEDRALRQEALLLRGQEAQLLQAERGGLVGAGIPIF